jgi:Protein of unknown function (DUF2905)
VDDLQPIGRLLVVAGLIVAVVGGLLILSPRLPWLGNLPGDIRIENENVKVFIPLGTMLLVSLVLTVLFNLLNRR